MFILSILLFLSLVINGILVWYVRKLLQNLHYGVNNVEEMQKLLNEYASLLEPIATMENYYGDPAITSAVANTRLVIEACQLYKNTIIENYDEKTQETEEQEEQEEQDFQEDFENKEENTQKNTSPTSGSPRKAEAFIRAVNTANKAFPQPDSPNNQK